VHDAKEISQGRLDIGGFGIVEIDSEDDLPVRITRIRLKPRILVSPNTNQERIRQLVEIAHKECYIANSLKTQVSVEPIIEVRNR